MHISGTTRVFLILGDPVAQVRAPEIFNHLFARHGVDAVLVPALVAPRDFAAFVRHGIHRTQHRRPDADDSAQDGDAGAARPLRPRGARSRRPSTPCGATPTARSTARCSTASASSRGSTTWASRSAARACWWSAPAAAAWPSPSRWPNAAWPRLALYDVDARAQRRRGRSACAASGPRSTSSPPRAPTRPASTSSSTATPLGLHARRPLAVRSCAPGRRRAVVDILMKKQPTPLLRACRARGIARAPGLRDDDPAGARVPRASSACTSWRARWPRIRPNCAA